MQTLSPTVATQPYVAYSYSYPHKTAYRPLPEPEPLHEIWQHEKQDALFLYIHLPFCEMRCGFCNLFTTTRADETLIDQYVSTLERQALEVQLALAADRCFARFALGGGTPTFLTVSQLERVFDTAQEMFDLDPRFVPTSIETSPLTAEPEKIAFLHERGVSRVSIGVQSFLEEEVRAIGRPQRTADVLRALDLLTNSGISTVNVDLIYGIPGQSLSSWLFSLQQAVQFAPEEIYLYPLYVRPLTGLGRRAQELPGDDVDLRQTLYRAGRDYLIANGYSQLSMRMFQASHSSNHSDLVYCCQTDGMIGIGCGARSYASHFHYATEYAVSAKPVLSIIQRYIGSSRETFGQANLGYQLNHGERKRRFVLQSLLQVSGLLRADYAAVFGYDSEPLFDFPILRDVASQGLLSDNGERLLLTQRGLELSDSLGVSLYSPEVSERMRSAVVL